MSDEPIDETERREAEALAHALERGTAVDELPGDALQTAALLRYSAGGSELRADREESVLAEVLEAAERIGARRAAEPDEAPAPWWRWLVGLGGAAALATLLVFWLLGGEGAVAPTELPVPDPALVSSGLRRLAPDAEPESRDFDVSFGAYRDSVYGAMTERYR